MIPQTYLLRTPRGTDAYAYDSLTAARQAKSTPERRVGCTLHIIERTITERPVE